MEINKAVHSRMVYTFYDLLSAIGGFIFLLYVVALVITTMVRMVSMNRVFQDVITNLFMVEQEQNQDGYGFTQSKRVYPVDL
jgi:hypothetical protein